MEPITLIITALAAGAALGVKDTASKAVLDAYNGLKSLARRRLAGRRNGDVVLAEFEEAPQVWREPLAVALTEAGAAQDSDLVAAAEALLRLAEAAGPRGDTYHVNVTNSRGVQTGDHNVQHNTFGTRPDR
jgi:hypothetical protein